MFLGFPIADRTQGDSQDCQTKTQSQKQKGIALMVTIIIIAVMMMFASDLILNSQVNLETTVKQRDNVRAEYLAKSGFKLALFLVSIDHGIDLFMSSPQSPQKKASTDSLSDVWSALNGIPIGGDTAEMIGMLSKTFNLGKVMDSGVIEQLKLFEGSFTLDVQDENQKINVNYCHLGRCSEVLLMLESLFSCGPEKAFLDSKKIKPRELAYKIKDYIDSDNRAEGDSGEGDESDPYGKFKYKSKNAPLDSLAELRMIDGWDEEVHAVFSPYLTVFPFQQAGTDKYKINLNTASRALLQCLVPEAKSSCGEKFAVAINRRNNDSQEIASGNVSQVVRNLLCYSGAASTPQPPPPGSPPGTPAQTDPNDKTGWFASSSTTFNISIQASAGDRDRVLSAVIERTVPDAKKGIKGTYRVLSWKLL